MNIREMHIEVRQATQYLSSNTRRKLLDAEIDWLLNKTQGRFIASKVKPRRDGGGFEVNEAETDTISSLFKTIPETAVVDGDNYYAVLPGDYGYLVSCDAQISTTCNTVADPVSSTLSLLCIPVPITTKKALPYYSAVSLQAGSISTSLTAIAAQSDTPYTGLNSPLEAHLIRGVLHSYLSAQIPTYWERYGDIYVPGNLIFPDQTSGSITIDGATYQGSVQQLAISSYPPSNNWMNCRLTKNSKATTLQQNPFYRSSNLSPIVVPGSGKLIVYGDASFIVSKVSLDYVRKPQKMSLSLGLSCELPDISHQPVCDLAVEYIKAMTADPTWEIRLKDNMVRSPLTQ